MRGVQRNGIADAKFFKTYLENEKTIDVITAVLMCGRFAGEASTIGMDVAELKSYITDELARLEIFQRFDSSIASWGTYLDRQVMFIILNKVNKCRKFNSRILPAHISEVETNLVATAENVSVLPSTDQLSPDFRAKLAEVLDPAEFTLIKALAEEDLMGEDLWARTGRSAASISRAKATIRAKIRKLVEAEGFLLTSR